jgi:hypothetical protein
MDPQKIFAYCERGLDPTFWAEPFNAVTNAGFIVAGIITLVLLLRRPPNEAKLARAVLILNLFIIGIGSFLFHTYAEPWSATADVAPIGAFMLLYLGYALYVFVRLPALAALIGVGLFAWVIGLAMGTSCEALGLEGEIFARTNCLNGSFGYLPALGAMLLIGLFLIIRRHPAAPYVFGAGLVFLVSVSFRSVDRLLCDSIILAGYRIGTHFVWHLLNSLTLFLLVLGTVHHGGDRDGDHNPDI